MLLAIPIAADWIMLHLKAAGRIVRGSVIAVLIKPAEERATKVLPEAWAWQPSLQFGHPPLYHRPPRL